MEAANGTNRVDLFLYGHQDQMVLIARFDNLGAVQLVLQYKI
ncbi:MAG: hypothetical protein ACNYPE_15570 [Candidatus Azotimanducaceae bacterium WSBS_2022_MAG_OTU7]